MLDSVVIVGLVMLIVEILKKSIPFFNTELGKLYIILLVFVIAGGLNVGNGALFGTEAFTKSALIGYLKEGLVLGAAAGGIYSMGKAALAKE